TGKLGVLIGERDHDVADVLAISYVEWKVQGVTPVHEFGLNGPTRRSLRLDVDFEVARRNAPEREPTRFVNPECTRNVIHQASRKTPEPEFQAVWRRKCSGRIEHDDTADGSPW